MATIAIVAVILGLGGVLVFGVYLTGALGGHPERFLKEKE